MANEPFITRLQRERDELIQAIIAVQEFHEARGNYENSPYKFDESKNVDAKREIMLGKFARVEPLLKPKENTDE